MSYVSRKESIPKKNTVRPTTCVIYLWVKRKRGVSQIGFFHTDAKADLAPERVREPVAEEMKELGQIKDIQIFPPFS